MADDAPTYEQARDELADVVRRLETGGTTLEEALALWEQGERLAAICQEWLDGARRRLTAAAEQSAQKSDTADATNTAEPADRRS